MKSALHTGFAAGSGRFGLLLGPVLLELLEVAHQIDADALIEARRLADPDFALCNYSVQHTINDIFTVHYYIIILLFFALLIS